MHFVTFRMHNTHKMSICRQNAFCIIQILSISYYELYALPRKTSKNPTAVLGY